jgi:hypothetical protein
MRVLSNFNVDAKAAQAAKLAPVAGLSTGGAAVCTVVQAIKAATADATHATLTLRCMTAAEDFTETIQNPLRPSEKTLLNRP